MSLNKTGNGLKYAGIVISLAAIAGGVWFFSQKNGNSEILTEEQVYNINQAKTFDAPTRLGSNDLSGSLKNFDDYNVGGSKTKRQKKQKKQKNKSKKGKKR